MSSKPIFTEKFKLLPHSNEKPYTDHFPAYPNGLVKGERSGCVLYYDYPSIAESVFQLSPRKDDVWIMTYPKSGTTWVSELVWLLKNNLNYDEAKKKQILERTCYPEITVGMPKDVMALKAHIPMLQTPEDIDKLPSPRVIRPHVPFDLLHPDLLDTSKVIYVARNPKDVMVSTYHFYKTMKIYKFVGTFEEWVELFMECKVLYSPYFPHVLGAWEKRNHPHMLFMFYEDLKIDIKREIKKIASFIEVEITDAEVEKLADHLDIKNLRKNEAVNQDIGKQIGVMDQDAQFMRKGIIGDWKNHFSPELNKRVDEWIAENLQGTGLQFITE